MHPFTPPIPNRLRSLRCPIPPIPTQVKSTMKKNDAQSGLFYSRILLAFTLCSAGMGLAIISFSAPLAPAAPGWSIVASANTSATQTNYLNGVTCVSASDCWAVGYYNNGSGGSGVGQTLIEHWNGTSWSIVPSPNVGIGNVGTASNFLEAVTC